MRRCISIILTSSMLFFAVICAKAALLGDVNGDGEINNKDVATLFRHVSGINVVYVKENCDVNGDSEINNKDVVALFRKVSAMQSTEPDQSGMSIDESDSEDSVSFSDLFG